MSRNETSASQRFYLRITWRLSTGSAAATRTQLVPIVPPYQGVDVPGTSTKWVAVDGTVNWDGRLDSDGCIPDGALPGSVQLEYIRQATTQGSTKEKVIDVLSTTASVLIRAAAPVVTLTRPPNGLTTNVSSIPVEGTVVGGSAPFTLSVNGAPVALSASGAFSTTIAAPEGASSITATATDCGGRTGQASVSVIVDSIAPQVSISVPAVTNLKTPPVVVSYGDGGSGVDPTTLQVLVDNIDRTTLFDAGATAATLKLGADLNLADGAHQIQASVRDRATNSGFAQARSVFVDTHAPVITLTPPDGTNLATATPTFRATLADLNPSSGIQPGSVLVELDGQDVTAAAIVSVTEVTFTPTAPLADGSHSWRVRATDAATNVGSTTTTVFVDTRAPVVTITPTTGTNLATATPTFRAALADPSPSSGIQTASVVVELDGQDVTAAAIVSATEVTFTPSSPLIEGSHTWRVRASDASANVGSASTVVFVDTHPPVIALTPADGANLATATPTFRATIADPAPSSGIPAGSVVVELTGNDVTSAATVSSSEVTFAPSSPLAEGSHTWRVRAADASANIGSASTTVFVDTQAPTILASPSDNTTLNTVTPTLSATFQDPAPSSGIASSSFTATVDGQSATSNFAVSASGATFTPTAPLAQGQHVISYSVRDASGNTASLTTRFFIDSVPPLLTLSPASGRALATNRPTLAATYADPDPSSGLKFDEIRLTIDGTDSTSRFTIGSVQASFQIPPEAVLSDGSHVFQAHVVDRAGNAVDQASEFVVDTTAPTIAVVSPSNGSTIVTSSPLLEVSFSDGVGGAGVSTSTFEALLDGVDRAHDFEVSPTGARLQIPTTALLNQGSHQLAVAISDGVGHRSTASSVFTVQTPEPPPAVPNLQPTPVDPTVPTLLSSTMSFLFTGPNAVQTGVTTQALDLIRMAVLRGRIVTSSGGPAPGGALALLESVSPIGITNLGGVTISVVGHPELGSTMTHADGSWDMAVNGGGTVIVDFRKPGYLPVQRQLDTTWQNFTTCPDVLMTPISTQVTQIDFSEPVQVARGMAVSDADGDRTATLLFFEGTAASVVHSDGTSSPLSLLNVRATEHTVGANGPSAMPAPLPPQSEYTYCASFTVDEALAVDAKQVNFSKPIIFYQENFLDFPTGISVPQGFYDSSRGLWVPSTNGVVVQLLSVTGGLADLDVDGSGQPANASTLANLGVSDVERQKLANLYAPGQSLWRVPLPHLTPWDSNWGFAPPDDATYPECMVPDSKKPG